ncbi:MAG: S-layer homology domain-containing protein [Magnetococcales bacterium]|nr:S-layer homology domain-containing protein [Magnetococcales bacterium]
MMDRRFKSAKTWLSSITAVLVMGLFLSGCQEKPKAAVSEMDNPWHHYAQGMEALDEGRVDRASAKFSRAIALSEDFSPALAGQSLIMALKAADQEDAGHRRVDWEKAEDLLDAARSAADTDADTFIYQTTAIRVLTAAQPDRWIDKARIHHVSALEVDDLKDTDLPYYQYKAAADYFMAEAWFKADFRKAPQLLTKVLGARGDGKWQGPADKLYQRVQKIIRASAGHMVSGKALQIAIKDSVTRGDAAALLVDELKLDKLLAGRIRVASVEANRKAEYTPADVLNHPFRDEISTMMKWRVRGLEPNYDESTRAWLFKPQDSVPRKDLALALEDVLIGLTKDQGIATAHIGAERSPYPDVSPNLPWFNACMTSVTRGLMQLGLSGEFRPDEPVSGADLLLAVFKLRSVMNIH